MAICVDTRCSHCGQEREFVSDCMALQLDDGSLSLLPHPAESASCERQGLTLHQASERNRLFDQEYFLCRRCGRETNTIKARRVGPGLGEPSFWYTFNVALVIAVVAVPLAVWAQRWDLVWVFAALVAFSPLIHLNERRKQRRRREREGRPVLPRPDAPGRVPVPEPRAPGPCCARPDLVPVARLNDSSQIRCATCGRGVLMVIGSGIS